MNQAQPQITMVHDQRRKTLEIQSDTSNRNRAMNGICPNASETIVFRDGTGNWKGRYRDAAHEVQDVSLSGHDAEQARLLLAQYLGIPALCIRVLHASHGVTYMRARAG